MRRFSQVVAGTFIAAVAGWSCDSAETGTCGFGGELRVIRSERYCAYSGDEVREAGDRFRCPPDAPNLVPLMGAAVCTSAPAMDAEDLPSEACTGLERACGEPIEDAGTPDAGPADMGASASCPPASERRRVNVSGDIDTDTTWSCSEQVHVNGLVRVAGGATLTIEPGAVVKVEPGGAVLVTGDGRIAADGTADEPIVLSSAAANGSRAAGDWLGLGLVGRATISGGPTEFDLPGGGTLPVGGDDDRHDCGVLRHVRVEFAGDEDIDVPALTFVACGSDTTVDHVQVHRAAFESIEINGGTMSPRHVVLSSGATLFWTGGWRGSMQHLIVQILDEDGDCAIYGDSYASLPADPRIYNATITRASASTHGAGVCFEDGTRGVLRGLVLANLDGAYADVIDTLTAEGATDASPVLTIEDSLFHGAAGGAYFADDRGDDAGFDEQAFFGGAMRRNRFDEDPLLADPTNATAPDFTPAVDSPAGMITPVPTAGLDATDYAGAIAPGGPDWTRGWTDYPRD